MTNKNLSNKAAIDIAKNTSAFLPAGSIVIIGGNNYFPYLSVIDQIGICPCDGRPLNTYKYRRLHSVISNYYNPSGSACSPGTTDQPGANTNFYVPDFSTGVFSGSNYDPYFLMGANSVNNSGVKEENARTHSHSNANTMQINPVSPTSPNPTNAVEYSSIPHAHYGGTSTNYANTIGSHAHNTVANGSYTSNHYGGPMTVKAGSGTLTSYNNHLHYWSGSGVANSHSAPHAHNVGYTAYGENTSHSHTQSFGYSISSSTNNAPYLGMLYFIKL